VTPTKNAPTARNLTSACANTHAERHSHSTQRASSRATNVRRVADDGDVVDDVVVVVVVDDVVVASSSSS
jgi:hypothetical protein